MKKLSFLLAIMVAASTPAFAQPVFPGHTGTATPSGSVPGQGILSALYAQGFPGTGGVNNAVNGHAAVTLPNGVTPGTGVWTGTPNPNR